MSSVWMPSVRSAWYILLAAHHGHVRVELAAQE